MCPSFVQMTGFKSWYKQNLFSYSVFVKGVKEVGFRKGLVNWALEY
jgi:hypothetical protein